MCNLIKKGIFGFFMLMAASAPVMAQVNLGVDVMSRYVWRGTDFGNSPSVQPEISLSFGNFTIGGWAAIATNGNPAGSEIDWFASYDVPINSGTFSLILTDYTFPDTPTDTYFDGTSHFLEGGLAFEGESIPISLFTGMFFTNDDDYSIYAEAGYQLNGLDFSVGFTPGKSALYGTSKAGIIAAGIGTSKEVQFSDVFSLTLNAKIIANPYSNNTFFLFGISF